MNLWDFDISEDRDGEREVEEDKDKELGELERLD